MGTQSVSAEIAVIGGTGLNELFTDSVTEQRAQTPYGSPSSSLSVAALDNRKVAFLPRHGTPHRIPPHAINYRANIWALKQLGVTQIVAVNAVGGIREDMTAGALVVPDQLVDYTYGREHTFADGSEHASLEHIDFTYPFDDVLRRSILAAASEIGVDVVDGATYAVTQGPRLETAAEINRLAHDGCDIVGMTAMPEAALARELDMAYASVCLVVNPAAGRSDQLITMDAINQVVETGMSTVRTLLRATIAQC